MLKIDFYEKLAVEISCESWKIQKTDEKLTFLMFAWCWNQSWSPILLGRLKIKEFP